MARDILAERAEIDRAIEGRTLCTDLERTASTLNVQAAFRFRRDDGSYDSITWGQVRARVRDVALGLASIRFAPGDFALIQARCIPEHSIADMGIVHARRARQPLQHLGT